jgi:SAM-dependent methyltransferase
LESEVDMESRKKKFYESIPEENPKGLLGWFFTRLRKFGKPQASVVFDLLPTGKRLLDVGCGYGSLAIRAKGKFEEAHGIDLAANRIKKAKANADQRFPDSKQIHFSVADVDNGIPYTDSAFDAVTCAAIVEHLFCPPHHIMRELNRVLTKGGTLIVVVPNIAWLPCRLSLLFGRLPRTSDAERDWDAGHLHYFTMFSLCELFKDAGFNVVSKTGSGIFSKLRDWWPSLLTGDLIIKGIKVRTLN